jgi:hypothetical protein
MVLALSVSAQPKKQEVISSAGGFNIAGGGSISISWTLGETLTTTFSAPGIILTPGFHNTYLITTVEENIQNTIKITIYPNPAIEILNIEFDTPVDGEISLYLLDPQGKLVKTDKIEPDVKNKQINMQNLPSGIYYLRLTKGKLVNVYKVVKL